MPDGDDADTRPSPAGRPTADGWRLSGRYRVLERIGRGGMAEVFRAHDELLSRDVAVKVFRTVALDADGATNGAARRELELQSLAQLSHPNLITLFDGSLAGDGASYLVLELVDGPDLRARLGRSALADVEARELGGQIAAALAYVHSQGLVHRDVKPANILIGTADGLWEPGQLRARLSDFGVVRMIGNPQMTAADMTVGTAYYIAPEQARGSSVSPAADVYSLGLVLLEALTGLRAFDGPMHESLAARLVAGPPIPPDLPGPWPALLTAMTSADPAARLSAAEVAQRLQAGVVPAPATTGLVAAHTVPPRVRPVAATAVTDAFGPAVPPPMPPMPPVRPSRRADAAPAFAAATYPPAAPPQRRRRYGAGLALAALVVAAGVVLSAFLWPRGTSSPPAGTPTTGTRPSAGSPAQSTAKVSQAADVNGSARKSSAKARRSHTKAPPPGRAKKSATSGTSTSASPSSSVSSSAPSSPSSPPRSSAPATGPTTSTADDGDVAAGP